MSLLEDKRGVMKPVIKQTASSSVWSNYEGLEDLDLKLPATERETILSEVGKILAGLNDDYLTVVRDVDDDQAIIDMVDANIQREHISPMEKARAYAMKLEAITLILEKKAEK